MRRPLLVLSVLGVSVAAIAGELPAPSALRPPPGSSPATQQPARSPQQPVFRAGVDHVSVDVVVTDKDDRPITDLTQAEFEIIEHGRTQTITDFQFVSVPVAQRALDIKEPAPPEPDVSTNLPLTAKSRLFALVIDDLHIIETNIVQVKRVMTDFVQALSPDDEVAVVFVGHSNLSQDFTTNTGRLLKAIDHVRDALGFGVDALGEDPGAELNGRSGQPSKFLLNYARSAAGVLRTTAAALAGSGHARRAIVFVSAGSPIDTINGSQLTNQVDPLIDQYGPLLLDDLRNAFEAARRADVPIYTVDPRGGVQPEDAVRGGIGKIGGLTDSGAPGKQGASAATAAVSAPSPGERMRKRIVTNIGFQQNELSMVAINTGGRVFINNSDLTRAVHEIVAENGSYYLVGYSPDPLVRDGQFHEFAVRVSRPGVRVRARSGYVAPAAGPASTTAKEMLDAAMSAGVNASGLSLRAFAAPVTASAKGMTAVVTVEVVYPVPADGTSRIDDELQMSVLALDADAKVKGSAARAVHFAGPAPNQGAVTFLIDDVVELPSQPLTLRVGVASRGLGKAGTVQIPIDVPNPKDGQLQVSGVVVGFAGPPREGAMGSAAVAALVPFQPTTTRTFAASDTLRVLARLFWGSKETDVRATLSVRGAGAISPRTQILPSSPAANGHRQAVLDTTVPLEDLPAGAYVLEVQAQLASGQSARREVVFAVKAP